MTYVKRHVRLIGLGAMMLVGLGLIVLAVLKPEPAAQSRIDATEVAVQGEQPPESREPQQDPRLAKDFEQAVAQLKQGKLDAKTVAEAKRAAARLEATIARLKANGAPTTLKELAPPEVAPDRNGATYLRRAQDDIKAVQSAVNATEEKASKEEQEAFDKNIASPAILAAIRRAFADHPRLLPLVEQASQCPEYQTPHDYSSLPATKFLEEYLDTVQSSRSSSRILRYAAIMQLADGKREQALESCLATLRLARLFDREPLIVANLVSLAVRSSAIQMANQVLRSGPLPEASYQALEEELARHDLLAIGRASLLTERAYGNESFLDMSRSPIMAATYRDLPTFKKDHADYLDLIEKLIDDSSTTYVAAADAQKRAVESLKPLGALTSTILPAVQAQQEATLRLLAQFRALRIVSAIARREQSGNKTPFELADLGLPVEVTTDPYNGKPLVLKSTPDGWIIYSVGKKLSDGGGTKLEGRDKDDVGLGPVKL